MKAVIPSGYGPPEVLNVKEVAKPKIKSDEILIQVKAASLNSGDVRMRSMDAGPGLKGLIGKVVIRLLIGITKPRRIPGGVVAGVVAEVGGDVQGFNVGDKVFAMTGFQFGGFAQYCALPGNGTIALMPKKASFEEASALPFGGNTSLYFLRKAGISKGKKVLIYGSTGAVGASAIQVARYLGAKVTAVCGASGMKLSKTLGADTVYDYKTTSLQDIDGTFDIIFDAVGKISKAQAAHLLAENGAYVTVGGLDVAKESPSDLEELAAMYDAGRLNAVIDKTYDMKDIVEANRYVDAGHKKGNVIIRIG